MKPRFVERVYRALLWLYPSEFRDQFGDEMTDFFRDRCRHERTGMRFWAHTIADVVTAAARERFSRRRRPFSSPRPRDSMLTALWQDLRFALRMVRKSPVMTAIAVAIIALGTGSVSTIFSVANAIVLRAIPGVVDIDRLAVIQRTQRDGGSLSASYPYYEHLAANSRRMNGIAAWSMLPLTMSGGTEPISALGNIVSGNYFDVIGVKPMLGRFFTDEETRVRGTYPVVVVSYGYWQQHLGADSSVVGKSVIVNGSKFTVVGVTPQGFAGIFAVLRTDAWVPLMMQRELRQRGDLTSETSAWLEMFGRLAPGTSRDEAQAELAALTNQYATRPTSAEVPHMKSFVDAHLYDATGLPADASGAIVGFFALLLALSALVLLIASVNVASMLLARAVARRGEISVRLALGAGPGRLVRQLLTESSILFLLGGAGGVVLAIGGTGLLERVHLPVDVPLALDIRPDSRVLAFTLAIAFVTGIVSGLAPALQASRLDLAIGLRGDTAGGGVARSRLRNALMIGQIALSLVLLSASGLFLRALERGTRIDPGFDATNVATAEIDVGRAGYDSVRAREFYRTLKARLSSLPGVTGVAYGRTLPLTMNISGTEVSMSGYAPPRRAAGDPFDVNFNIVDDGYFSVLRTPILRGRGFTTADGPSAPPVLVVNESFAKLLPSVEILGRTVKYNDLDARIVGVVRDSRAARLNAPPGAFIFAPATQQARTATNLLVRTSGDPAAIMPAIRDAVRAADPNLPAPTLTTLSQATSVALLPQRVAVAVTGVLGVAGLLLAAIGLYGVLSFAVAQRTRELGVRIALGATSSDVLRLIVGQGMRLAGMGMAIGVVLALVGARLLSPFLFGVSPADPITFLAIGVVLTSAVLLASYLPARRASKADPVVSLRA
jgi:putative ABC transport system permease protein